MEYQFADRVSRLSTAGGFAVLERIHKMEAEGKEIIQMQLGEPDFHTPQNIVDAAIRALNAGEHHYTPSRGILPLRKAIAEYVSETRKIDVHPDEVVVVPGGKPMIFFPISVCIDHGDQVLYPNPLYPPYESSINYAGGVPVPVPLLEDRHFAFDVDELERRITPKTKMLVINSPGNPTGGMIEEEDYVRIAEIVRKHDLLVLSDEIYSRMIYDGDHVSLISQPGMKDHVILLDGFSKTYAMTGWRLGYGVMPRPVAEAVNKLMLNVNSCTATFVQHAGIEALKGPQDSVDMMLEEYRRRKDLIVNGLNRLPGFSCTMPLGAFYAFPNVSKVAMTSNELAEFLLMEAGVSCLSGTQFGEYGEGYLRFSYATSIENIEKALFKMEKALKQLPIRT
ncbi:MAG: pyridoxal phosphate-dependent aminotransferase [Chloroflexi bacterium]|nr:pyridoxal phosphate-dependent aminotransferase [Chloroflexota bacterium]